jgi:hypothetical protein
MGTGCLQIQLAALQHCSSRIYSRCRGARYSLRYGVKWDTIYRPPTDFRFGKKPKATKMARSQNDIRQYVRAHSDCTNGLSPEAFVSRFSFTWNLAAQNRAS